MSTSQEPTKTWTRYGHRLHDGVTNRQGYAQCILCGAHENMDEITEICPGSTAGSRIADLKHWRDTAREHLRLFREVHQARGGWVMGSEIMKRIPDKDEYDRVMKRILYARHPMDQFMDEIERLDA